MTAYLLPCSCGLEIPVDGGQAGGNVRCACGKEIDVPTLGAMTTLRPTGDDATGDLEPDGPGVWRRTSLLLLLIGMLVVSGAIVRIALLYAALPAAPSLDRAKAAWTVVIWRELRKGVEGPLFRDQVNYHKSLADWESRRTTAVILALAGLVVLLPAVVIRWRVSPARS